MAVAAQVAKLRELALKDACSQPSLQRKPPPARSPALPSCTAPLLSFCALFPAHTDAQGKDAAAGEANRQQLAGLLDEAEQQLSRTQFLAGDAYSVADVMFTPILFRLGMAGKTGEYLKPRPNVSSYYNR